MQPYVAIVRSALDHVREYVPSVPCNQRLSFLLFVPICRLWKRSNWGFWSLKWSEYFLLPRTHVRNVPCFTVFLTHTHTHMVVPPYAKTDCRLVSSSGDGYISLPCNRTKLGDRRQIYPAFEHKSNVSSATQLSQIYHGKRCFSDVGCHFISHKAPETINLE